MLRFTTETFSGNSIEIFFRSAGTSKILVTIDINENEWWWNSFEVHVVESRKRRYGELQGTLDEGICNTTIEVR